MSTKLAVIAGQPIPPQKIYLGQHTCYKCSKSWFRSQGDDIEFLVKMNLLLCLLLVCLFVYIFFNFFLFLHETAFINQNNW